MPRSAKIFTITGTALTESARPAKDGERPGTRLRTTDPRIDEQRQDHGRRQRKPERSEADQPDDPDPRADEPEVDGGTGHSDEQHAAEQGNAAERLDLTRRRHEEPFTARARHDGAEQRGTQDETSGKLAGRGRKPDPLGQTSRAGTRRTAAPRAGAAGSWDRYSARRRPRTRCVRSTDRRARSSSVDGHGCHPTTVRPYQCWWCRLRLRAIAAAE